MGGLQSAKFLAGAVAVAAIEIVDGDRARHTSTWRVVMKTNVDIHTSAIGRYEDELVKREGQWFIGKRRRIE